MALRPLCILAAIIALVDPAHAEKTYTIKQQLIYADCQAPLRRADVYDDSTLFRVEITVKADGSLQWNGIAVSRKNFAEYIHDAVRHVPQPAIFISGEAETRYTAVAAVIGEMQIDGIRNILLSTGNTR